MISSHIQFALLILLIESLNWKFVQVYNQALVVEPTLVFKFLIIWDRQKDTKTRPDIELLHK